MEDEDAVAVVHVHGEVIAAPVIDEIFLHREHIGATKNGTVSRRRLLPKSPVCRKKVKRGFGRKGKKAGLP